MLKAIRNSHPFPESFITSSIAPNWEKYKRFRVIRASCGFYHLSGKTPSGPALPGHRLTCRFGRFAAERHRRSLTPQRGRQAPSLRGLSPKATGGVRVKFRFVQLTRSSFANAKLASLLLSSLFPLPYSLLTLPPLPAYHGQGETSPERRTRHGGLSCHRHRRVGI